MDNELIGTLASCLVLISFLFNDIKVIRITNIIGCIVFIIYGVLIKSFSIIFLNAALLITHIIKLIRKK